MYRQKFFLILGLFLSLESQGNDLSHKITENLTLAQQEEKVLVKWEELQTDSYIENTGPDASYRSVYVGIQGAVESALADEDSVIVTGVIHTKRPPTPLLTEGQMVTPKLVAESVLNDPQQLKTITSRANIIRRFLASEKKLYAAYPKSVLQSDIAGMNIYQDLLQKYPNQLVDAAFDGDFPEELTGATYVIQLQNGQKMVFSIMALQANDPKGDAKWAMWYGSFDNPKIQERFKSVSAFLNEKGIYPWN